MFLQRRVVVTIHVQEGGLQVGMGTGESSIVMGEV